MDSDGESSEYDESSPRGGPVRPFRIGYVEDHPIVVTGLRAIVEVDPLLVLAASAPTVDELLAAAPGGFDVVLLDLYLGDGSKPEQNVVRFEEMGIPTLVFSSAEHPDLLRSAARGGVRCVLRKDADPDAIRSAIRAVAAGDFVHDAEWAAAIDADPDLPMARLTPTEARILGDVASGYTDDMIGRRLGHKSRETVKQHLKNIRTKYRAMGRDPGDRARLAVLAVEDGHAETRKRGQDNR